MNVGGVIGFVIAAGVAAYIMTLLAGVTHDGRIPRSERGRIRGAGIGNRWTVGFVVGAMLLAALFATVCSSEGILGR